MLRIAASQLLCGMLSLWMIALLAQPSAASGDARLDSVPARGNPSVGLKVIPWTVNDPKAWARLLRLGVDGMITDDPEALIAWRARQAR